MLFGGSSLETCSSRLGRHYEASKSAKFFADTIDWVAFTVFGQMNHCKGNILLESHYVGREAIK